MRSDLKIVDSNQQQKVVRNVCEKSFTTAVVKRSSTSVIMSLTFYLPVILLSDWDHRTRQSQLPSPTVGLSQRAGTHNRIRSSKNHQNYLLGSRTKKFYSNPFTTKKYFFLMCYARTLLTLYKQDSQIPTIC